MAVDALVAPLLRIELFQGLKPLQITEIARNAERIVFRAGDTITEAGADADAAFLIVGGAAEWTSGLPSSGAVEPIEIGSLIGEMAMFIEYVYGATIVATGPVRCLKLSRETLHRMMLDDASLAEHLTLKISNRLGRVASELRAIDEESGSGMPDFVLDVIDVPAPTVLQTH